MLNGHRNGSCPVKVIAIDPLTKRIAVDDVPQDGLRRFGGARSGVAKLPNGDVVLAVDDGPFQAGFSIGGSKPIRGAAIVVGKQADFGERFPARSAIDTIERLVRWLDPEPVPRNFSGQTITVILVDPEAAKIDCSSMDCSMAGIDALVGGEAVPMFDAPGGDVVYGTNEPSRWRWRKDNCVFNGRCVIVGSDRTQPLTDPVASLDVLRSTVEFVNPGVGSWTAYTKLAQEVGSSP